MMCELSIIIVTWNTRELLRACLASLTRHHGGLSHEIIVVDNASEDGTVEMIRRTFPHVDIIANATNRGFGAANNQAIARARGEFVLLLNSDTEVTSGVLRSAVAAMREQPDVAVLGVRVQHPDGSLQLTCFAEPTLVNIALQVFGLHRLPWPAWFGRDRMRNWARDSIRDVDVVTGCFFMLRPRAMEEVGLFDEQYFFYGEETDWCRRFRAAGWAVRFVPAGTIVHHGGASAAMLDGDRGVLLADGIVRFHHKHAGAI
ncbi:MAG: glycosyltransferase family 2 protein, partial [Phycisphaerales bacterium]|nr:glycosyltransferase family 2 protein [Phycisphaerales bacterium]